MLTVPGEQSYKDRLIVQKIGKIKSVCTFFSGKKSKDFVRYRTLTLDGNEFDTVLLHMGVKKI